MALSCKQHKMLPLQMEKNGLRQAEKLKNQKSSLRAGKGKRQVVTCAGVSGHGLLLNCRLDREAYALRLNFFTQASRHL